MIIYTKSKDIYPKFLFKSVPMHDVDGFLFLRHMRFSNVYS